jgi:uncharacterized protein YcbX
VKSMGGELLESCDIDSGGIVGDHSFAVVDADDGTVATAKNPRRWGALLGCAAAYVSEPVPGAPLPAVAIRLPDASVVHSDDAGIDAALSAALGRPVRLISGASTSRSAPYQRLDEDGNVSPEMSSFDVAGLGTEDRYYDLSAFHVVTTSTLAELVRLEPQVDFDERRFRPGLVLETVGTGFVENDWVDHALDFGAIRLDVVQLSARCVMPGLAQAELPASRETVQAIARHNRQHVHGRRMPCAGVYASVAGIGTLRIGDRATIA